MPTLDWRPRFDERSRDYPIRQIVGAAPLQSKLWACNAYLNQGEEGACVGFGWSHELAAKPLPVKGITNEYARNLYQIAQRLDEWPGEDYSGTSVLAGAKAVQSVGYMSQYRWAFSLDDILRTLGNYGPVVLGIPWYEEMYCPDSNGFIKPLGEEVGGHCILARGVAIKRGYVTLHNSWGGDWGVNGDCRISFSDLDMLIHQSGESCVPVVRK